VRGVGDLEAPLHEGAHRFRGHVKPRVQFRAEGSKLLRGQCRLAAFVLQSLDAAHAGGLTFEEAASKLSAETGLAYRPSAEGEHVSGVYRQRVTLSSGRFAMIDDAVGFQFVPWRPALEQQLGK
jgi:hypothetical protein